eukprot:CAMPEP_0204331716 /NCGR_PEP_ID=MMETSP0469-20131031/15915_1 /ASSEMBLY_ACC=CAM_ASM_000384 /TAXON_ID=2969 /ORGANISM="Oxyrrhis marina" /LENGTH=76 /DNA_ID=CAMNT_0051314767 /DNA_START=8 /DNA_END=238 /DNA_ORIENTATION=+
MAALVVAAMLAVGHHNGTCPTDGKCPASVGTEQGLPCCQVATASYDCCPSGTSCIVNVGCGSGTELLEKLAGSVLV